MERKPTVGGKIRLDTPEFEPPEVLAELLQVNYLETGETLGGQWGLWATWKVPSGPES